MNPLFKLLDKLSQEWQKQWTITWFVSGAAALIWGFLHSMNYFQSPSPNSLSFESFKLAVALIGMGCVVALAFRRNLAGNGLGALANSGEIIAQGGSGATGLMLTPIYNLFTHLYALNYWSKNQDLDGNMIPKRATGYVWLITLAFLALALYLFPIINNQLQQYSFIEKSSDIALSLLGIDFTWYQINIAAFVVAISAQTTMILRYAFSWWLWFASNLIWFAVNFANHNTIFLVQTAIYQINCIIGIYEWWRSSQR